MRWSIGDGTAAPTNIIRSKKFRRKNENETDNVRKFIAAHRVFFVEANEIFTRTRTYDKKTLKIM